MDKKFVSEINNLKTGEFVDSIFVVGRKTIKKTKAGEDFCLVCLQDRSGSVDGVIWPESFRNAQFEIGDFVIIRGEVEDNKYSDNVKKQLKITQVKKIENKNEIKYSDFIRSSKKDIDQMITEMESIVESVKNIYLSELLNFFFQDENFRKKFFSSSAAVQYHHAYLGGLLDHSLTVTKICNWLAGIYESLNRDLLVTGAILHDVGKIKEYELDSTIKISDSGRLLGHIAIGYGMIQEKIVRIKNFPDDLADRLLHIILSHHGYKEFGSPKRPKILEAFLVFHVDNMDADIGGFNMILEENGGQTDWSVFLKNFERSVFLKELKMPGENNIQVNKKVGIKNKNDYLEPEIPKPEKVEPAQDELF